MFDKTPAVIELFGHQQIAGYLSEASFSGQTFFRVDVPQLGNQPGYTKLYGTAAVYAITPVDESIMLRAAQNLRATPIQPWMMDTSRLQLPAVANDDLPDDFDRNDYSDDVHL